MAEFQKIMKITSRMCKQPCHDCPLSHKNNGFHESCFHLAKMYPDLYEKICLDWEAEHPEKCYPTWIQWWNENFDGEGRRMLQPCCFMPPRDLGCNPSHDGCMVAPYKCWHTPIPESVALKLNIKPISE